MLYVLETSGNDKKTGDKPRSEQNEDVEFFLECDENG